VPKHKILGADDVQQGYVMLGQLRDLGEIFVKESRIVRIDFCLRLVVPIAASP